MQYKIKTTYFASLISSSFEYILHHQAYYQIKLVYDNFYP